MAEAALTPEDADHRFAGLTKLLEITCELAAEHDLDRILAIVTRGARTALSCERASLYLYDRGNNELYTRVATELEIEEIRTSAEQGITGWVARNRDVANIPDPRTDPRWNSAIDQKTGFQTRNILAAPVISPHDERLLGVLQLLNKTDGSFDAFDERMIQAFASHAATALERAELLDEARRSQELEVSIDVARQVQRSFLPDRLPDIPGYEVATWWQPAEEVSGDYYDILPLPDGRLGLVVADVSGHGVGPSLIMASVRAMLHVLTRRRSDPATILPILTESIYSDLHEGRFVTFLMGTLDPQRHEFTFVNAGHWPALHFERESRRFRKLESTTLPIGFTEQAQEPPRTTVQLAPGDLLLLATDGLIEVRNEQGIMFGRERLEQLLLENRRLPARQLLEQLREAVRAFRPGSPPDDITVLLVERKRSDEGAQKQIIEH